MSLAVWPVWLLVIISCYIYHILSKNMPWPNVLQEIIVGVLVWTDMYVSQITSFQWHILVLIE